MNTRHGYVFAVMLCALALTAPVARAESVTLSSVSGVWTDPEGPSTALSTVVGVGTPQIRWGSPFNIQDKSGLRFIGNAPQTFNTGNLFNVGLLTHFNNPINSGTALTGVKLTVALTFSDPTGLNGTFPFEFEINETPNNTGGSADNDIISFGSSVSTNTVLIGGTNYHLQLLGFTQGGSFVTQFSSPENGTNNATLVGRLTSDPSSGFEAVPLPGVAVAGFALMGGAGLTRGRRRRI